MSSIWKDFFNPVGGGFMSVYRNWTLKRTEKKSKMKGRITDTEDLTKKFKEGKKEIVSIKYKSYKKTYKRTQLKPKVEGKEVKAWNIVKVCEDSYQDEFIPIFKEEK